MPDSTANGITYPVPGDYVKAAGFASKLAKDFETLALTADQAIVAGVAQGIIPVLSGYVKPKPIPSGTDLLTLDTGWWYNRLTSVAGTMLNRPPGVSDGPFMVHMVRTPFGHSTITYYGYSGTAGGLFENHTGNAAHTVWVGWRRLDGTTGGGITQGSGLAGFANILRTQMFRDAMGPVTTGGKGAIAFRFDHGLSKFNSIMRPLLEARGIKYSLALSARNFDAGENAGVTASMVNSWTGAEVWNHGANQHQDESSVAGLTDQIVTGLAELQAALPNKQIWGYAVPGTGGSGQGGFFGGATAEQFYETAAGDLILTNHAVSSGSMSGTSRRPLDGRVRQGMAHFTIEAQTVARIKSEIDNAISNKTGNQLMMHPNLLNTEGYLTTAQLVEVLDYVVAKRDAGDLVVLSPYEMLVAQLSTSGGSGVPGPPGAGVPAGGEALQVIRKNAFNTTTEWATLTKSLVGLSNVDNTSDMNKPVSTMQKLALDEKIDAAKLPDEVDGVNKNLIEDTASLTAGALSASIDDSVAVSSAGHTAVYEATSSRVRDLYQRIRLTPDGRKRVTLISGQAGEVFSTSGAATSAPDTARFVEGTQAIRLTATGATTARISTNHNLTPLNFGAASIVRALVWVDEPAKINTISVVMRTQVTPSVVQWSRANTATSTPLVVGWNLISWVASSGTTTAWGTTHLTDVAVATNAATAVTIQSVWVEVTPKAQILFIEDRGYQTFVDNGLPDLRARNIPVTWALDPAINSSGDGITKAISDAQVAQFYAEGDDMSIHSYDGAVTDTMTPEQIRQDTLLAHQWLQDRGYTRGRKWRAAWTQNKAQNHAAADPYYAAYATPTAGAGLEAWPFVNPRNVGRINLHGSSSAQLDSYFATIQRTNGLMVCYTHGVVDGLAGAMTPAQWAYFLTKLDEGINGGWLEGVTFSQLLERSAGVLR